jgi:chromosomal replication initiation ATPase DnaA
MSAPHRGNLIRIATETADDFGVGFSEIYQKTTKRTSVHPRQEAMLRQRELGFSYPVIGNFWGCHHTTVMDACVSAENRRFELNMGRSGRSFDAINDRG